MAHILNAEGEKIQKALDSTDNIDDLLAINHSINQTLVNVTHLEHVLFAKLDSALYHIHSCKQASECDNKFPSFSSNTLVMFNQTK